MTWFLDLPFAVVLAACLLARFSYLQAIFILSSAWLVAFAELPSCLVDTAGSSCFQASGRPNTCTS